MADAFEKHGDHASGGGFMLGLLTGTVLGAGLGMLLAPKRGSELRSQIGEHAASFGRAAGEQLRRAGETATGHRAQNAPHASEAAVAAGDVRPTGETA